jgi:GDP/UDP-N,N'-diacetylbacillosamine 2-epimerase (hydrolysing)
MKRKIAVLTGKRGGFGALISTLEAIERDPDMTSELIVTDMHLSSKFGNTVKEVEKWFSVSHRLDLKQKSDSRADRARALGRFVTLMTDVLENMHPDILLVLGDRGEVLSACIAATELHIPIAHILGGDIAGNVDGNRIHAITKLSHLHFPSNKNSAERIRKMGEEPWRIHTVGATYLDLIFQKRYTQNKEVRRKYGIGADELYAICIEHPPTFYEQDGYRETKSIITALRRIGIKTVVTYPCSDPGYEGVLKAIREIEKDQQFLIHKNIEAVDFWGLMSGASFFIGNSSSGLMETPYFNLPSINVGNRQEGRIRDINVVDVSGDDAGKIRKAINQAVSTSFRKNIRNHYIFGRGGAGEKISAILKKSELGTSMIKKYMTY